jgi:hypothetical protein
MAITLAAGTQIPRVAVRPDEAAEATGFSRTRIFSAIRDGELTARKDGKVDILRLKKLRATLAQPIKSGLLPTRSIC